jgi:CRISPR-associated protein Csb1
MASLDFESLRNAVAGSHVAIRSRTVLQPAGGPGDKVYPSSYGVSAGASSKYAVEEYVTDGVKRFRVLLGSVADQANRHELALLEALEAGDLSFPNPYVDFTIDDQLADLGHLSALEAPHRFADAIFRDSMLDGTLFRLSDLGRQITDATPNAATALYASSPAALVFGMWDSTGPKGGLGSKFQRALVSEIVGYDAQFGVKVGSRIDPLQIEKSSATVFEHADPDQGWTLDESEARMEKGKPVAVGSKGELGRPSVINHGNVTPSIDSHAGGVTISEAVQTTVLSLAALRKLRFVTASDGSLLAPETRRAAELAARTALAALAVAAIAYQHSQDYDLRSRCLLVPQAEPTIELVSRTGAAPQVFVSSTADAAALLAAASNAAAKVGMGWSTEQVRLTPSPKLCDLVRRSRDQLRTVSGEESA